MEDKKDKKEKEELKAIDFTKAEVENIDGSKSKIFVDGDGEIGILVKQFANVIYSQSKELGEVEVAREIYKTGQSKVTKEQAVALRKYAENYPYILRTAIEGVFDVFK
jgi:hypothetical protein|nr:MAG TPA: hypothetical protein [Caudoviricetes sp.]